MTGSDTGSTGDAESTGNSNNTDIARNNTRVDHVEQEPDMGVTGTVNTTAQGTETTGGNRVPQPVQSHESRLPSLTAILEVCILFIPLAY